MNCRIFQPVVYSKIDPNRCKSISIDRNVSYDTLLDAANKTMLIVSSETSENRPKIEYFDVSSLEINENIRKFIKNRPKRRVTSHGHRQVDRNVARASPSPNKVEYQVIRITMIRWSSSNTSGIVVEYGPLS